jgi:glycosyltransferase involved in cell wall biosynthesis
MRILVISEVFHPEDFMINDLVREWVKMGHEVEVVTQYPSYPQSYVFEGYENKGYQTEDWDGVKIHRYPFVEGYRDSKMKKFRNYYSFVRGGKRVVNALSGKYDCAFVSQTGPLTVAYPALYAKKKLGIPVNIWTYDIWPDAVYGYGIPKNAVTEALLGRMIRKIYGGCDRIFITSKKFAETIGRYSDKECIYAPNWLRSVESVQSAVRLEPGKFHFTFTGNVSRYQNLINTVEGFAKAGLEQAQLNIVGDGSYLAEVKKAAAKVGNKNVVFHGRRPYNEMYDLMMQSNVLLLPLMPNEGIEKTEPLKLQSYLQADKPIFGILNGAGRNIINENHLGLCVSPTNIDEIAIGFKQMVAFAADNINEVKQSAERLMTTRFNKNEIVRTITEKLVTK